MDPEKIEALRALGVNVDEVLEGAEEVQRKARASNTPYRLKDMGMNGMNPMDTDESNYDSAVVAKVDAIDTYLSSQGAPLTAGQRKAFLDWYQKGGQDQGLIEEKLEDEGTDYETMAGEIERTLEKLLPRNKTEKKSYDGRSRLVGEGNTWLDRFASGRPISEKKRQSIEEWMDSLPQFDEKWFDRWVSGEEVSDGDQ
jgi:hypothetical protein